MADYGVRDVERVLQISRSTILGLIKAGFVSPVRGSRGEYRFSFQDLIVLRTARALSAAKVSPRRITRSLKELRRHLPEQMPLSGLSIRAVGDRVVVQEGSRRWQADSGQYLLELDILVTDGELSVLTRDTSDDGGNAEDWFNRGWELEEQNRSGAREAYEQALQLDPGHAGACANLGRLLHEAGEVVVAEQVYREGVRHCGSDPLILFNLAVLLEDVDRLEEAIQTYEQALQGNPRFADCHYNLALAYEVAGDPRRAIRHLGEYRKLQREAGR
jgi:tetratricopeptide (TPR) repeat protein